MKKILIISGSLFLMFKSSTAQSVATSWMHNVKSWQVFIYVEYLDSANASNYTRFNFTGSGSITNEISPAGARMTWPLSANPNPESYLQIPVTGIYERKYAEEPGPSQVEAWTCTGKMKDKISVSLGATLDGKYNFNFGLPYRSIVKCSGKEPPADTVFTKLERDLAEGLEPTEGAASLVKDCGTVKRTLIETVQFNTAKGARVRVRYSFAPL